MSLICFNFTFQLSFLGWSICISIMLSVFFFSIIRFLLVALHWPSLWSCMTLLSRLSLFVQLICNPFLEMFILFILRWSKESSIMSLIFFITLLPQFLSKFIVGQLTKSFICCPMFSRISSFFSWSRWSSSCCLVLVNYSFKGVVWLQMPHHIEQIELMANFLRTEPQF